MTTATPDLDWTTARDGSRSARVGGRWLAGCSVPRRAAQMMLRKLTVRGQVACLLLPTHAQQIVACLEKLDRSRALIVLASDAAAIEIIRQCHDFSPALASGQLFFAADESSLQAIFQDNPGLPIPQQFIRLPVTPQVESDAIIPLAQRVFSAVTARQARQTAAARAGWKPASDRLCVVVSRGFKLWDDAGDVLARAIDADVIDLDNPRHCAGAYIAERARDARAIVTVNTARADQPELIHPDQPWIAWITSPRVPAYAPGSPGDGLLAVDEAFVELAIKAGWPRERIRVAGYLGVGNIVRNPAASNSLSRVPTREGRGEGQSANCNAKPSPQPSPMGTWERGRGADGRDVCEKATLVLAADVPELSPPGEIAEYSSWRVVWDAISKDLPEHPHRLAGDIDGYLEKARRHFGVPADNFPRQTFVDRLIGPAYLIGIARWLMQENIPLTLHGLGWDRIEPLARAHQGAVNDREQLQTILRDSAGLVDAFLAPAHPIRSAGRPLLRAIGRTPQRIIQDAASILSGRIGAPAAAPPLTADRIRELLQ